MKSHYEMIVIGAGSAGYHAARVASTQNRSVALIEADEEFGGLCILRGCMPTKTMLRSAEVAQLIRECGDLGLSTGKLEINWRKIVHRKRRLVNEFADYRLESAEGLPGIEIIRGWGSFVSPTEVYVNGNKLTADHFVLSTGSRIWNPDIPGLTEVGYINSDDALELSELPRSIAIYGGGPVAIEFAQLFQRLGTKVTVVQRSSHILSSFDHTVAQSLERYLQSEGITILTESTIVRLENAPDGKKRSVITRAGREFAIDSDEIMLALGRKPAIDGLNCGKARIDCPDGQVQVDQYLRTSNNRVFAGGDVVGGRSVGHHQLVHVATQQGEIIGHNAFHLSDLKKFSTDLIPQAVFTDPSVGIVGMTAREASFKGYNVIEASETFEDQGKALTMGQNKGLIKIVADRDNGHILGVHILGPNGSELIHEAIVAMYFNATIYDIVQIPHLHPTLSELLLEPAEHLVSLISES